MIKKIEMYAKNFLLKGLLLFSGKNKLNKGDNSFKEGDKILCIRLNRIGDALVTTPLLEQIKKQLGLKIFVLASTSNRMVFDDCGCVDEVIQFQKGFKKFKALLKRIELENFSAIVDLHDDVSTTVSFLIALAKVPIKFGLKKSNYVIYTHTIEKPNPLTTHVIERNLALLALFGLPYDKNDINIVYTPSHASLEKAETFIRNKFPSKKFLVGINISAGNEARFWGVEQYKKLYKFLSNYPVELLILCSTRDLRYAIQIAVKNEPIYYSPSFNEFAGMISKLDFLFTPDTSTVHLASAYIIPMFGIYVQYNTDDLPWTPYKSEHEIVITKESNFNNVSFEAVIHKLKPFIEKYVTVVPHSVV